MALTRQEAEGARSRTADRRVEAKRLALPLWSRRREVSVGRGEHRTEDEEAAEVWEKIEDSMGQNIIGVSAWTVIDQLCLQSCSCSLSIFGGGNSVLSPK
jgi:hypothetical protein